MPRASIARVSRRGRVQYGWHRFWSVGIESGLREIEAVRRVLAELSLSQRGQEETKPIHKHFFPSLKLRKRADFQRYTMTAIFANPLNLADPPPPEPLSLIPPQISLFPGQNSLLPVLEIPVNFTGIWGNGSRNSRERRDLPG